VTRRMPKRGPGGRFLPRDAQAATRTPTPSGRFCFECAAHPEMDVDKEPCFSCLDGHDGLGWDHPLFRPSGVAPNDPLGVSVQEPAGRQCDECGSELEYTWMHVGRHSYHVGRCARCAPPPTIE